MLRQPLDKTHLFAAEVIVVLLGCGPFHYFTQVGPPHIVRPPMTWPAPALVPASPETIAVQGLTFGGLFFALVCICKLIGTIIAFALGTLVDVHPFKVHFSHSHGGIDWIFDMPETGVAGVDVNDGYNGCHFPSVTSTTVKVWSGELDRSRIFVGTPGAMKGEGGIGIIEVADANVVDSLGVV